MSEPARPLRQNRDYVLLWTGEAASALGSRTAIVAYPLLVLGLTGSPAAAGALSFARTLPWLLFALVAGAVVDRTNRRTTMLVSDGAAFVAVLTVAVALAVDRFALPHLFVAVFVEGTAFVFLSIAYTGPLKQLVPAEQLPDAVAQTSTREFAASLAGPPVGGFLFELGRALPFGANALSYAVSFATLTLIRTPFQEERERAPRAILREVREGLAWLWRQPFVRASLFLVAGANLYTNALYFSLIVIANDQGASPGSIGVMLALPAASGFAGALAAPRLRRFVPPRLIVVGYAWIGAAITLPLVAVTDPLALGAIFSTMMFFGATWDAVVDGYRIALVPDRLQGRVESASALTAYCAVPLGPLAAGLLLERFSGDAVLVVFGGFVLAVAALGTLSRSLRLRDQPSAA